MSEIIFQPSAEGTPLHRHDREEKMYYVIEGQLEVHVGDQITTLKPGGSVLLPRRIPHKVRPIGDAVTRALMVISPPNLVNMLIELDRLNDRVGKRTPIPWAALPPSMTSIPFRKSKQRLGL